MQAAAAQSNQNTSCADIEGEEEEEHLELSGSTDLMIENDDRGKEKSEKKENKENPEHNCV